MPADNLVTTLIWAEAAESDLVASTVDSLNRTAGGSVIEVVQAAADDQAESWSPTVRLGQLLGHCRTPFVSVVRAGDEVDSKSLDRRINALLEHPTAVIAACDWTEARPMPGRTRSQERAQPTIPDKDPGPVDGRVAASRLLCGEDDYFPSPTVAVLRVAAIAETDVTEREEQQARQLDLHSDWHLHLFVRLLVRGSIWFDPLPGAVLSPRSKAAELDLWARWPSLLSLGSELELLDETTKTTALAAHSRRSAHLLRDYLGDADPSSRDTAVRLVRDVSKLWRGSDTVAGSRDRLPIHAVVQGPSALASQTVTSLAELVEKVSLVTPGAVGRSATGELPGNALESVQLGRLPILMLQAGERPEVLDRFQLQALLKQISTTPDRQGMGGTVLARSGDQVRLSSLKDTPATPEAPDATRVVHSLRVVTPSEQSGSRCVPAENEGGGHRFKRFVIAAPDYTNIHGGVVALHRLCDCLNANGYDAFIEPLGEAIGVTHPGWNTPLWPRRDFDDVIVVYPEIVTGNPLNAARVVRWLLNRPAWFTRSPMEEQDHDLVITYNHQIDPTRPEVNLPLVDPSIFFPKDVTGSGALLWIGKGSLPSDFNRSGMTLLTNDWPASRREFAAKLRAADVLFTCDWLTSVIGEALMCATPVVLIGPQTWSPDEVAVWPGMARQGEPLDQARRDVSEFYPEYLRGLANIPLIIEHFVQLVNDHFRAS